MLGCGGHAKARAACTVTAHALAWDTAHEVGHALLTSAFSPVHVEDDRNLMFKFSRKSAVVPVLTDRQVAKIRASVCCRPVKSKPPAPARRDPEHVSTADRGVPAFTIAARDASFSPRPGHVVSARISIR